MGMSPRFEGFAVARVAADEAEILSLGTVPEARRQGLARLLLDRVIHEATVRGGRRLFLEVAEDNGAALQLYSSFGFLVVGARKAYYSSAVKPAAAALMLRRDSTAPG